MSVAKCARVNVLLKEDARLDARAETEKFWIMRCSPENATSLAIPGMEKRLAKYVHHILSVSMMRMCV